MYGGISMTAVLWHMKFQHLHERPSHEDTLHVDSHLECSLIDLVYTILNTYTCTLKCIQPLRYLIHCVDKLEQHKGKRQYISVLRPIQLATRLGLINETQ